MRAERADWLLSQGPRRLAELRGKIYRWLLPETFCYRIRVGRGLRLDNPRALRLGKGVILSDDVTLLCRPCDPAGLSLLEIGAKTFLNRGAVVSAGTGVRIGEDVLLGPGVLVVDEDHTFDDSRTAIARQGMSSRGRIDIGDGAWIAAGAVILSGTTLAPRSVVAAGAVVRGHYPRRCLLAGAPARVVRFLDEPDGEGGPG